MDLNELASFLAESEEPEQYFPMQLGPYGLDYSETFDNLLPIIGNEARTRAVLSAAFWQVVSSSRFFGLLLDDYIRITHPIRNDGRLILSMHDADFEQRYDLLILSQDVSNEEMTSFPLLHIFSDMRVRSEDFVSAFAHWLEYRYDELNTLRREDLLTEDTYADQIRLLDAFSHRSNPYFVQELASIQRFSIMIAPMPSTIPTTVVISPAWGVSLEEGANPISTVGVVTSDRQGVFGATAALHGVVPDANALNDMFNKEGAACVVGKSVYVNGKLGIIRRADLITDSCFIEIDSHMVPNAVKQNGPLKGKSPYPKEPVTFEGMVSSKQSTYITGVDMSIPNIEVGRQARVYTHAVTNPGDSGAALVNSEGYVLGFSYGRTGLGEPVEFADWIWADSVYNALKL